MCALNQLNSFDLLKVTFSIINTYLTKYHKKIDKENWSVIIYIKCKYNHTKVLDCFGSVAKKKLGHIYIVIKRLWTVTGHVRKPKGPQ